MFLFFLKKNVFFSNPNKSHLFVIFVIISMEMTEKNFNFLHGLLVNSNAITIYSGNDMKPMENALR